MGEDLCPDAMTGNVAGGWSPSNLCSEGGSRPLVSIDAYMDVPLNHPSFASNKASAMPKSLCPTPQKGSISGITASPGRTTRRRHELRLADQWRSRGKREEKVFPSSKSISLRVRRVITPHSCSTLHSYRV